MGIQRNGLLYIKELSDPVKSDYIWYRACLITGNTPYSTPGHDELQTQLSKMSRHEQAGQFMRNYGPHDNPPLNTENFISLLYSEFEQCCLKKDYFDWIKDNDERLIRYLWKLLDHYTYQLTDGPLTHWALYDHVQINNLKQNATMTTPFTTTPNKISVICCINRLNMDKHHKTKLVDNIKLNAELVLKNQELTGWLKTDTKAKISWLPIYLNSIESNRQPNNQPNRFRVIISESSSIELDIISYFDILCTFNVDRFKLMILNMKKAWSQRKYREKNNGKKQYSINMSRDIGSILDEISSKRNINKNELVELLIRSEYKNCNANNSSSQEKCKWEDIEAKYN